MAQPPPVQRPLKVRAQDVLANVQAGPAVPVPQHGPQAVHAVPAHEVVPDNEAVVNADNANQNPAPPAVPEPALEVKPCFFLILLMTYAPHEWAWSF